MGQTNQLPFELWLSVVVCERLAGRQGVPVGPGMPDTQLGLIHQLTSEAAPFQLLGSRSVTAPSAEGANWTPKPG